MKFLKTGNSMYALDLLKVAGADMTSPKPIEDAMALFEQLLKELEPLLNSRWLPPVGVVQLNVAGSAFC